MRDMWPLLINDGRREAQTREFLDFLSILYGDEFAAEIARKTCEIAVGEGDTQARVYYAYRALGWKPPDYVEAHDRERRRTGREPSTSGQRQMARRLKPWFEKWAR
jgi:hypothetical protein